LRRKFYCFLDLTGYSINRHNWTGSQPARDGLQTWGVNRGLLFFTAKENWHVMQNVWQGLGLGQIVLND
jgi:hypothetical protein